MSENSSNCHAYVVYYIFSSKIYSSSHLIQINTSKMKVDQLYASGVSLVLQFDSDTKYFPSIKC